MSQEIVDVFEEEIDFIINKFHGKKSSRDILKWLDNFDEEDKISALEILRRLRYVSEEELFAGADNIVNEINNAVDPHKIILFYPIAKYGKSATLMSYYFQKSSTFKKLERSSRAKFIINDNEARGVSIDNQTVIVFFDDFFGSGGSFVKNYRHFTAISVPEFATAEDVYAACLYYMPQAKIVIQKLNPHITLIGEEHPQIFGLSPLMFYNEKQRVSRKELAYNYADSKKLFKDKSKYHYLGYEESEALISFPYVPPNNTLPIIWSGRSKWNPLFPRMEDDIFDNLKSYKEQLMVAATRIDFGLPNDFKGIPGVTKTRFITFGLLRMLNQNIVLPQIAVLMGAGISEIENFVEIAKKMGMLDQQLLLTEKGNDTLREILRVIQEYKDSQRQLHPSVIKKAIEYLPGKISGK
jgi:hypothetical protein